MNEMGLLGKFYINDINHAVKQENSIHRINEMKPNEYDNDMKESR